MSRLNKDIYVKGGSKKYILTKAYQCIVPFFPLKEINTAYACVRPDGWMDIATEYEWDGPSGPTIDTEDFMEGALVHDVLYQMIREKLLPMYERKYADICLKYMCLADGMPKWRAWYVYWSVRACGRGAATM